MTNRSARLGGVFLTVLGVVAGIAETFNYLGIPPEAFTKPVRASIVYVRDTAASVYHLFRKTAPKEPVVLVSGKRSARLVLIVENQGDIDSMKRIKGLVSSFASRLIPEDSVSLITFTDGGHKHAFVFKDESGRWAPGRLAEKIGVIFPFSTIRSEAVRAASKAAWEHLHAAPSPGMGMGVIELSIDTAPETLDIEFKRLRADVPVHDLALGPPEGEG